MADSGVTGVSGRRIALVGGAGFIGHNLALELKRLGAQPIVIDSLAVNNYYSIKEGADEIPNASLYLKIIEQRLDLLRQHDIPLIEIDSRDYHRLSEVMFQCDPDAVVQLAAVAHAGKSNKDPYSTFDHSLRTLENALDASRSPRLHVKHFVYFSSSMVYGNFVEGVVCEETPCEPLGIYGALKYAGEKMVIAYHQVFGIPYTIVRPSALYGERCVSRRVGQIFIENALQGLDISINGDGSERLDFTYIGDLVQGMVRVLENEHAKNETFNLTYGQSRSTAEMAEILHQHFPEAKIKYLPKDRLTPSRGTLSIEKARRLIGYQPRCPLETGFVDYITWYKSLWQQLKDAPSPAASTIHSPRAAETQSLQPDGWLSQHLGRDAYTLVVIPSLIAAPAGARTRARAELNDVKTRRVFITAKIPVTDAAASAFLEEQGFRLIDTNLRFEKHLQRPTPPSGNSIVRLAEPGDKEAVVALSRRSFRFTRFHQDPLIPKSLADEVKGQWAAGFFAGTRGDRMVVGVIDGKIVGFALLAAQDSGRIVIDLIAVDEQHRRRGIAADMIAFVEAQIAPAMLVVGTQVANVPSVCLYETLGFRLTEAQYVFHFHNPAVPLK